MTTPLYLFLANFTGVFALGLQQYNVQHDRRVFAFLTSLLISTGVLVQIKLLAVPSSMAEILAFVLGGATGIVACMWMHTRAQQICRERKRLRSPEEHAKALTETLRLATELADAAARSDIESQCVAMQIGTHVWYDTRLVDGDETDLQDWVDKARTYLQLRNHIRFHPTKPALVRFARGH